MNKLDRAILQLKEIKNTLEGCSPIAIRADKDIICKEAIDLLIENLPKHHKSKEELDEAIRCLKV